MTQKKKTVCNLYWTVSVHVDLIWLSKSSVWYSSVVLSTFHLHSIGDVIKDFDLFLSPEHVGRISAVMLKVFEQIVHC